MKKRIKKLTILLITAALLSGIPFLSADCAAEIDEEEITAQSAVVIDFETGDIIYSYNANDRRPPASMTKAMVVYLVYEAIGNGSITTDTIVPVSEKALELANNTEYTNVKLQSDEIYTVGEMLDAVIIVSACGATVALAEFIAGSVESFLVMMNAKAVQWDIDASFYNVYGGTDEKQESLVSAHAMATIVRNTIMDFPEVLEITSKETLDFRGKEHKNTNTLLGSYEGLDGFKTGYTRAAGACLASTAERDGTRIIAVVMGAAGNAGRFGDTEILLDYGFEITRELRELAAVTPSPEPSQEPAPTQEFSHENLQDVAQVTQIPDIPNGETPQAEPPDSIIQNDTGPGGAFWFFMFLLVIVASLFIIALITTYFR